MSKQVILVTGASSGFGLMTAQFLALAGHTVYASMRETRGRNATQVAALATWSTEQKADLPGLINMLAGSGGLGGLRR